MRLHSLTKNNYRIAAGKKFAEDSKVEEKLFCSYVQRGYGVHKKLPWYSKQLTVHNVGRFYGVSRNINAIIRRFFHSFCPARR